MNTYEIIELLKKAINSEELADVEVEECKRFIDDIEIVVNDYVEDGTTTEDDIIEKCTQAVEYLRLVNFIDNDQLDELLKLPLLLEKEEEVDVEPVILEDEEVVSEEVEEKVDDSDDFDRSCLDC